MTQYTLQDIAKLLKQLRTNPNGCAWHRLQTRQSLRNYILEEAYEVVYAIEHQGPLHLCEELADLLFQVIYQCELADEEGLFSLHDVMNTLAQKLLRRHPHVFENPRELNLEQLKKQWDSIKSKEKGKKFEEKKLTDHGRGLHDLRLAYSLIQEAAKVGFAWPNWPLALNKVREEIEEIQEASLHQKSEQIEEELGDLLLATTHLAYKLHVDPSIALQKASQKFATRFDAMIELRDGQPLPSSLEEWVELWTLAKQQVSGYNSMPKSQICHTPLQGN